MYAKWILAIEITLKIAGEWNSWAWSLGFSEWNIRWFEYIMKLVYFDVVNFSECHSTVRIKIKVIHIQRPIVLKSIDLKICVWHISKEQLILFPLVHFLHQVCHAWPSTLPLKMTMSWPTVCKFGQLDKSVIAKQCNDVAAEIVSSHARWSFPFWKIVITRCLQLLLVLLRIVRVYLTWISGYLGIYLATGKTGPSGHSPLLSCLRWNQRWICWRCWCIKGPGQKIILPIITKTNLDNLQWLSKLSKCNFSVSCE